MPRPFPDINQPIYAPDKTKLRNKISLLTSSNISFIDCDKTVNLPLVFLSSTKQAMCTGRQELWYGSFFKILNIRNIMLHFVRDNTKVKFWQKCYLLFSKRETLMIVTIII